MAQGALPGFRDFYPEQLAERAYVMTTWRDVARRYAFVEYDGPPLEPLELYTKKSGDEIVGQLYNFVDKGDREIALRPEMTPTLARMVGARANALRKPVRWFSMPQLFRYERQQKGRLREHYQLNVDLIGEADVTADAELMACAIDMVRAFGLTANDVVARVSDRRILQAYLRALGIADPAVPAVFAVIDKLERQPRDVSAAKLRELLDETQTTAVLDLGTTTLAMVRARLTEPGDLTLVDDFARYQRYVTTLVPNGDTWLRFDLTIVRGLAYYTGIVFELFDRSGEFRAICGGGRYDTLLGSLGGAELPALGFGMGDVVLTELLRAKQLLDVKPAAPDVWVLADNDAPVEAVMAEAARLRAQGKAVEFALRPQTFQKQQKAARSAGARESVIVTDRAPGGGVIPLESDTP
jgi:histidyl-tRNA synthetase